MTAVTDYTGILYATDGSPDLTWNTIAGTHTPVIVTYSFVKGADLAGWEASAPFQNGGYNSFNAAQRANFRDALALFAATAGIIFVEVPSNHGMINAISTPWAIGAVGWATPASSSIYSSGNGVLVDAVFDNYDEGTYGFQVLLHELGHAMGLQHPFEGGITLDPAVDDLAHTVMTYNNSGPPASHLGTLDVAAMAYLYGPGAATLGWTVGLVKGVLQVTGSARDDVISGVWERNLIWGADGNDSLFGRMEDDTLHGGFGNDHLTGLGGSDLLLGESGNDRLFSFGTMSDYDDKMDSLFGGGGDDRLYGGYSMDSLVGGAGRDYFDAGSSDDTIYGGAGADRIYGGKEFIGANSFGLDQIFGGGGDDSLFGGTGWDTIYGGGGNDALYGGLWINNLFGGNGDDTLIARGGDYGDLRGGDGGDLIRGGTTDDTMFGGNGNDSLFGGGGSDGLFGDDGDDVLTATTSRDLGVGMYGGAGADRFVLMTSDGQGYYYMSDFTTNTDKIDLSHLHIHFRDLVMVGNDAFSVGMLLVQLYPFVHLTPSDFVF